MPQVNLVDGIARKIGIYSDEPDWWPKLKVINFKLLNTIQILFKNKLLNITKTV